MPWSAWNEFPEVTDALQMLSSSSPSQEHVSTLEEFVAKLYDSSERDVDSNLL